VTTPEEQSTIDIAQVAILRGKDDPAVVVAIATIAVAMLVNRYVQRGLAGDASHSDVENFTKQTVLRYVERGLKLELPLELQ
jgi:hypothetical protein